MPDQQGVDWPNYNRKQAYEMVLLALCVWREARNQPFEGKLAVAWSIRNRVMKPGKTWWGDDWETVILKRWQYTSFEKSDPNACLLPTDPALDKTWDDSLVCAERAYLSSGVDTSQGATHYYNPKIVAAPAWVNAPGTRFVVEIGDHRFYVAS